MNRIRLEDGTFLLLESGGTNQLLLESGSETDTFQSIRQVIVEIPGPTLIEIEE